MKNVIIPIIILQYPDFSKPFLITVGSSKLGSTANLSQNFDGHDLRIYFALKSFSKSEQKKPIIELELSAIHFAIKQFRSQTSSLSF